MSAPSEGTSLELVFSLKHIEQHLAQNETNTKRLLKLQQRIMLKERLISCKGAVKIYQAYETLLQDMERHLSSIDHAMRLCEPAPLAPSAMDSGSTPMQSTSTPMQSTSTPIGSESLPRALGSFPANDAFTTEKDDPPSAAMDVDSIPVGALVAALTDTGEGSQEWILARVRSFDSAIDTYTVEDAEMEEEGGAEVGQKGLYCVSEKNVVILPESEEAALRRPEFRMKQSVLALFPGTTCFYSAVVMSQPSRRKRTLDYLLKFADDDVASRPCPARYVLRIPR